MPYDELDIFFAKIDYELSVTQLEERLKMNFSEALNEIKAGKRLTRSGWNGRGMFVYLVPGSEFTVNREPFISILGEGAPVKYLPHIDMKYACGSCGVWLCSQSDMMAEDWEVV